MDYLPNLEIEQMCGRAGRPKYDTKGEAILVTKNSGEYEYAKYNYIFGETENIYSKLGVEPVLRTHILALIASNVVNSRTKLLDFFKNTFYAFQYKDFDQLELKIESTLQMLQKFGFIEIESGKSTDFVTASELSEDRKLIATPIGKRVSQLYIDPITADYLIKALEKETNTFGVLHMLARCMELRPPISVKKKDIELLEDLLTREKENLVEGVPDSSDFEYDDFLASIKTSSVFLSWIEEKGEDIILQTFGVTPGELRARLEILDWLLYSSQEIALLLNKMDRLKVLKKVRVRVSYGVREELLPLVRLKGIGRVKARNLFNSGLKDVGDLKKIPLESLTKIVGQKTAEKIKEQL